MKNIIIFSGEDIVSSRKGFLDQIDSLKTSGNEIIRISGKDFNKNLAVLNLESDSLFLGEKRVLAVESFFSGPKSVEKENVLKYLSTVKIRQVVFWEGKEFSKIEILKYPENFDIKTYKIPQKLFLFLDSLLPKNTGKNLSMFNEVCESTDAGFIFQMLIRQSRLLIMVKEDLVKLAPWQVGKLKKQSGFFEEKCLHFMHTRLLGIDYEQKTSSSPINLKSSIEVLLSEI